MASEHDTLIAALIALHGPLRRQGPGDDAFTRHLLDRLPALPRHPLVADMGCGTGASALVLAQSLNVPIACVDAAADFITILKDRVKASGLNHLIQGYVDDMATYRHPDGPLDLLWSEGAAYHLTFAGALTAWRPTLKEGGLAVISELTWFKGQRPADVDRFWATAYPTLADEATNVAIAKAHGYDVLFTERLPSLAWQQGYYGPLRERAELLSDAASDAMRQVIDETLREIALFDMAEGSYGYTFYGLRAA